MAPTPTRDATSHTPAIHPEAFAIAHAFTEDDWNAIRASIPEWHPRNDGGDAGGGDGGNGDGNGAGNGDGNGNAGGDGGNGAGNGGGDQSQLGEGGKAALEAERAARKAADKRAREAEEALQAIADKDKSDTQKAADAAAAEKQRADKAELELARLRAAAKAGIPADLADRLKGSTEAELLEDAEALKTQLKPAGDGGEGGDDGGDGSGATDFGGGARGNRGGSGGDLYSREQLEALSPQEVNANWDKVRRSMAALKNK